MEASRRQWCLNQPLTLSRDEPGRQERQRVLWAPKAPEMRGRNGHTPCRCRMGADPDGVTLLT